MSNLIGTNGVTNFTKNGIDHQTGYTTTTTTDIDPWITFISATYGITSFSPL